MGKVQKSNPNEGCELTDRLQARTTDLPPASENPLKFARCTCKQGFDSWTGAIEENLVFHVHIGCNEYRSANFITSNAEILNFLEMYKIDKNDYSRLIKC